MSTKQKYEVTLTRPAYEIADVEISAETQAEAEAEAIRLAEADELEWRGGDRLPGDEATVVVGATRLSEDQ